MDLKRRKSFFNLFKKLIILLICFCLLMFILLNYYCTDQCYWNSNNYLNQNKFNRKLIYLNDELVQNDQSNNNQIIEKSDQLIGLKKKVKLINRLIDQSNEYRSSKNHFKYLNLINNTYKNLSYLNQVTYDQLHSKNRLYQFDLSKDDVLIFLHIQKTGGTSFGKRLVHDLKLIKPCECFKDKKHCSCIRPIDQNLIEINLNEDNEKNLTILDNKLINNSKLITKSKYWLFSRYSTGWICGLHADYTQLQFCADNSLNRLERIKLKRRYFFITVLRDPVSRFLSEYGHVKRGATWKKSKYACSNDLKTDQNLENSNEIIEINKQLINNSRCYLGDNYLTIDDWIRCDDKNLAINRQTRMLADLVKIGCLNTSQISQTEYNRLLLESAKLNLNKLAYFGLLEYQLISQFIFESTFNLEFKHSFIQLNRTHSTQIKLNNDTLNLIKKLNYLDQQLYEYAKELLFKRFESIKKIKDFNEFKKSKLDSLDNLKENLDKFPELRLMEKLSKRTSKEII